jgi:hypothetical protein
LPATLFVSCLLETVSFGTTLRNQSTTMWPRPLLHHRSFGFPVSLATDTLETALPRTSQPSTAPRYPDPAPFRTVWRLFPKGSSPTRSPSRPEFTFCRRPTRFCYPQLLFWNPREWSVRHVSPCLAFLAIELSRFSDDPLDAFV